MFNFKRRLSNVILWIQRIEFGIKCTTRGQWLGKKSGVADYPIWLFQVYTPWHRARGGNHT